MSMLVNKSVLVRFLLTALLIFLCWFGITTVQSRFTALKAREKAAREKKQEEVKVTLIEGLTNEDVFTLLAKQGLGTVQAYQKAETRSDVRAGDLLTDIPSGASLQGFLFPDTYQIAKGSSPEAVLQILIQNFVKKFNEAREPSQVLAGYYILPGYQTLTLGKRVGAGFTVYDLVTLASIIEKETGRAGEPITSDRLLIERRTVAGIFLNRLLAKQPLQSDATINYITKSGRASSTAKDLEVDSPYNTYKYAGLPPGPIANVSYSSLYAVLHPIKTDFFYFLHSQTDGQIYYAKTYEEQLKNKAKYLK
jgi:UPF0755 protein